MATPMAGPTTASPARRVRASSCPAPNLPSAPTLLPVADPPCPAQLCHQGCPQAGGVCPEHLVPRGSACTNSSAARLVWQGLENWAGKTSSPWLLGKRAWHGSWCPPAAVSQLLCCLLGESQRFPNLIYFLCGPGCLQHLPSPRRGEEFCLTCLNEEDTKPRRIGFF